MKKHFVKIVSMLVCLTVVFASFPIGAKAAETVTYKITTKICNGFQNGTNSNKVNFTFYGTERTHKLTNVAKLIKGDAFERNRTDTLEFSCESIGQIYSINVSCGTDAVKFEYIKIEKITSGGQAAAATFSINQVIDNTNKTYYANRENIYRVKVVTADNPFDGTKDNMSLTLYDNAKKSFTINNITQQAKNKKFNSGTENSFICYNANGLGDLSSITIKNTSNTESVDEWRPLYIQVEKMSSSTTAGNIKWGGESLFVVDKNIGVEAVSVAKYTGLANSDSATGLASIFYEPNFYIIIGIILLMCAAGIIVYYNKKQQLKKGGK